MKSEPSLKMKVFATKSSFNNAIFISVLSDDPELLHAAQSEGFVSYSGDDEACSSEPEVAAMLHSPNLNLESSATRLDLEGDDIPSHRKDTGHMNDITREELKDALLGLEDRVDRRIDRMGDELQREMRLRERSARREAIANNSALKAHIESNDKAVASTLAALSRTETEFGKVKQANKEQRYWMAGIGVAIVLGIMGANATIFSGGKSFFDGGKEAIESQRALDSIVRQAQEQTESNRRILDEIRAFQLSTPKPKAGE
ncbi:MULTISPECIES: hypothetical protein [unclassified Pseudomonas]|uniref:hypothetical protein n=1 Tax=unclassified Pseudomonas TaxID=196821 RepID=UPI001473EF7A|nr:MULTISPECIES: hypothetical protein [unclassified Pseudomonas]NMX94247.1 hypothetical protein [Pseudomonas sp. WS 5086]NMY48093.1 hypothetical protein [Pseudomonas sp. WS 5027]